MWAKLIQAGMKESESWDIVSAYNFIFLEKLGYLSYLIKHLEPLRAMSLGSEIIAQPGNYGRVWAYLDTHNVVRWKRVLVYLVPGLHRELAWVEKLNRYLCHAVLYMCDRIHTFLRDKDLAALAFVMVFDEIKHLMKMENPNPSAVDHVQLALKARLKVLCSQIFNFDGSTSKKKAPLNLVIAINRVPELSFCLPPAYRDYKGTSKEPLWDLLSFRVPNTPLGLSACLLRRSDSNGDYSDNRQTEHCCCGWAFDNTPQFILRLFGQSAQSFARFVHSGPWKVSLGDEDSAFDIRQAMNAIFGGPWSDDSSLRKSMNAFSSTLTFLLWRLFQTMGMVMEKLNMDPEMAVIKDSLDRIAEHCRRQFFVHLLRSVVAMYHEFRNSHRESETSADSFDELRIRINHCAFNWQDSESDEFISGVVKILFSSILAGMIESDDPDLSSDEVSTQDERQELPDDADVSSDKASIADEL